MDDKVAEFSKALQGIVLKRIEEGQLDLPALPAVAMKARRLLGQANTPLKEVAKILEKDPVLAAELLRTANSAGNRRNQKIHSIGQAVTLLGAKRVKSLLIAACAKKVFSSKIGAVNKSLMKLWEHSIAVANLCQDVAGLAAVEDTEIPYLTGLLHDIGKPIIGIYLLEFERALAERGGIPFKRLVNESQWLQLVHGNSEAVGAALARHWELPEEVAGAIEACDDYDPTNRNSVVNIVRFTNALTKKAGIYVGEFDEEHVDTLIMMGRSLLDLEEEVVQGLIDSAAERLLD